MILTLLREQFDSQRRYVLTATVMVLLATALLSFAATSWGTAKAFDDEVTSLAGYDRENLAVVALWTDGEGLIDGQPLDLSALTVTTPERVEPLIAEVEAVGSDVHAGISTWVNLDADPGNGMVMGSWPGEEILVEGAAPSRGEIALMAALAERLGLSIGDTVTVQPSERDGVPDATPLILTVSGLSVSDAADGPWTLPGAWVDDATALDVARTSGSIVAVNTAGERTALMDLLVGWNGPTVDALAADTVFTASDETAQQWGEMTGSISLAQAAAMVASGALAIVAVGASLAAARGVAASRSRWVGTARALGARRRDLVAAGALEGIIIGVAAGGLGVLLGWGAVAIAGAQTHARVPSLLGPVASLPGWLAAAVWGCAVALALALTLIPAVRSAQTAPVDALRPSSPAPSARRVLPWWTAALALALGATLLIVEPAAASMGERYGGIAFWLGLSLTAGGVLSLALAATRYAVRRLGARWQTSRRPALVAASGPLAAGTAGVLPAMTGLLLGGASMVLAARVITASTEVPESQQHLGVATTDPPVVDSATAIDSLLLVWLVAAVVLALGGAIVGLAEWLARTTVLAETSTVGALGLDRHGRQLAAIARVGVPMAAGAIVGLLTALAGAGVFLALLSPAVSSEYVAVIATRLVLAALGLLASCSVGVGVAVLFAARSVDATSPQEAARLAR